MTTGSLKGGCVHTLPIPPHGRWAKDVRGEGRAVRVSAHTAAGFLILSTWKADECVGTVRLVPNEAAELLAGIAEGLADLAGDRVASPDGNDQQEDRFRELELRLRDLESQGQGVGPMRPRRFRLLGWIRSR